MSEIKKTIDWNQYTPATWTIAEATGRDVGVAASMVQQNIMDGAATNPGAETLPEEFRPVWDAPYCIDCQEENDGFNAWVRTFRANYAKLCELWKAKDYEGMVTLMDATADPGPIDGIKPGEDVPTPLGDHE